MTCTSICIILLRSYIFSVSCSTCITTSQSLFFFFFFADWFMTTWAWPHLQTTSIVCTTVASYSGNGWRGIKASRHICEVLILWHINLIIFCSCVTMLNEGNYYVAMKCLFGAKSRVIPLGGMIYFWSKAYTKQMRTLNSLFIYFQS